MESLADDIVATGQLGTGDRERFVSTIKNAARRNELSMRLTMFAVAGERPTR